MKWRLLILQEASSLNSLFLALQSFSARSLIISQSEGESSLYSQSKAVKTALPDGQNGSSTLAIIFATMLKFLTASRPL